MPRLNVEERFFAERSRYLTLAKKMGWHEASAKGMLITLWHASQSAYRICADSEQICIWAEVMKDEQRFIESMCHPAVRFLKKKDDDWYEISGNKKQVRNLKKVSDERAKAGRNSGKSRRSKKSLTNPHEQNANKTEQNTNKRPTKREPIQCSAMQYNAVQDNARICEEGADAPVADATTHDDENNLRLVAFQDEKSDEQPEKKKPPSRQRTTTWSDDHKFARVFTLLKNFEPYGAIFDVKKDEKTLNKICLNYKIPHDELYKEVFSFVQYWEGMIEDEGAHLTSPRGRLATWMRTYETGRNRKERHLPQNHAKQQIEKRMTDEFMEDFKW